MTVQGYSDSRRSTNDHDCVSTKRFDLLATFFTQSRRIGDSLYSYA